MGASATGHKLHPPRTRSAQQMLRPHAIAILPSAGEIVLAEAIAL